MKHAYELGLFLLCLLLTFPAWATERAIEAEVVVDAPLRAVWEAWTTEEGLETFFAPECHIDLRSGGVLEILFSPEAPAGRRGAEGNRVLAVQPEKLLSFTWDAPPSMPEIRAQRTHVTVRFEEIGESRTRVIFRHDGWGEGEKWDEAFTYFNRAWKEGVLPNLVRRFESGPLSWDR